jgi:hypothetical protein
VLPFWALEPSGTYPKNLPVFRVYEHPIISISVTTIFQIGSFSLISTPFSCINDLTLQNAPNLADPNSKI